MKIKIIPFLKASPSFASTWGGGQYNGYLLIPKELVKDLDLEEDIPQPHGGVTLVIKDAKRIKEFVEKSQTWWIPDNHLEHPDYSKYICVGFDTLHVGDEWNYWTFERVSESTMKWKRELEKHFNI